MKIYLPNGNSNVSLDRVKELNYDHHYRMTKIHLANINRGLLEQGQKINDESYRELLQHVPKDRASVVELGSCSGGQWPILIEWLVPGGKISGIDLYEPFVKDAQKQGKSIHVGFVEEMTMFGDGIADLVCSRHVMEHLGNVDQGIKETLRVTEVGGYIANVTPDLPLDNEPAHLNKWTKFEWIDKWLQFPVQLISAERYPYNGGEVHIVCRKN